MARRRPERLTPADTNRSARATMAVPWRWGVLLVTTAFVAKLIVLMQLWNHPLLQPHGELDTAYYVALSQRVAQEGVLAPIGAFFVSQRGQHLQRHRRIRTPTAQLGER